MTGFLQESVGESKDLLTVTKFVLLSFERLRVVARARVLYPRFDIFGSTAKQNCDARMPNSSSISLWTVYVL
jgi:hypothetical protein